MVHVVSDGMTSGLHALDRHGDQEAGDGMLDFAVNVRGPAPSFVRSAIGVTLDDLARYPSHAASARTCAAIANVHGRATDEVMLLAGAADGFELLPKLGVRHAALLQPSFTEPELVLRAAGIAVTQVVIDPAQPIDVDVASRIPPDADLVVVGNPTNPTSMLHDADGLAGLRRPGRVLVVDEAFADLTIDPISGRTEPQSLAHRRFDDVIVVRSVTKTFGLAGLRAGYLLGAPDLLARLQSGRRAWPLSSPALAALAACVSEQGVRFCAEQAIAVRAERDHLVRRLDEIGVSVSAPPSAPFVLIELPHAFAIRESLRNNGIAVRSAANFVGLGDDHVRLAVRPADQVDRLVTALERAREEISVGHS
ncbi:Rv2231c family pyridoxal phosphate-dependent protein CobC [Gordonia sp. NPDC003504]